MAIPPRLRFLHLVVAVAKQTYQTNCFVHMAVIKHAKRIKVNMSLHTSQKPEMEV